MKRNMQSATITTAMQAMEEIWNVLALDDPEDEWDAERIELVAEVVRAYYGYKEA